MNLIQGHIRKIAIILKIFLYLCIEELEKKLIINFVILLF